MRPLRCAILGLLLFACPAGFARDLAVVVHKGNSVKNIPLPELIRMCRIQTRRWNDGRQITLVVRDPFAPEMKLALHKLYGMSPDEAKTFFGSANQAHRELPAVLVVNSDEVLIKAVETNPGAIGIVDVYSITGGIKVVKVDGKSPLEPGYALHGN